LYCIVLHFRLLLNVADRTQSFKAFELDEIKNTEHEISDARNIIMYS